MLLRTLHAGDVDNALLEQKEMFLLAKSLERKGLIDAKFSYSTIEDMRISYEGKAYMSVNSSLKNPINWGVVSSMSTITLLLAVVAIAILIR